MKRTFVLLLALLPMAALAQTGTISGTIGDENTGELLIGANATILGTMRGAATNIDGEFVIDSLPPGNYTLRFSYIGYDSRDTTVFVGSGDDVIINLILSDKNFSEYQRTHNKLPIYYMPVNKNPGWNQGLNPADGIMFFFGIGDPAWVIPYGGRAFMYL